MSLIRLLRDSDVLNDGRMLSLKIFSSKMQDTVNEKNIIIGSDNEKIKQLESTVLELQTECASLKQQIKLMELPKDEDEHLMSQIMKDYEITIANITVNYQQMKKERDVATFHLANLEFGFADLVEKYERLKIIIIGYQNNQDMLLKQIEKYKCTVSALQERYDGFTKYANEKLREANAHVEKKDKKHISELAKVKSKALQSKVKICEMEKVISVMSTSLNIGDVGTGLKVLKPSLSLFAPLTNKFS